MHETSGEILSFQETIYFVYVSISLFENIIVFLSIGN
jgi:hypothetical protein